MSNKRCGLLCLGITPFLLLLISLVLTVVGYVAVWGAATVDAGSSIVSSEGVFTLWTVTFTSKVAIFETTSPTYSIDSLICDSSLPLEKVQEVCRSFDAMRHFTTAALTAAALAVATASLAACASRDSRSCRFLRALASTATSLLALAVAACALMAVAVAANMPHNNRYFNLQETAGPGSVAMVFAVVTSLIAAILEMCFCCTCCCCRGMPSREEQKHMKAHGHRGGEIV